jgi:hypothetical protein
MNQLTPIELGACVPVSVWLTQDMVDEARLEARHLLWRCGEIDWWTSIDLDAPLYPEPTAPIVYVGIVQELHELLAIRGVEAVTGVILDEVLDLDDDEFDTFLVDLAEGDERVAGWSGDELRTLMAKRRAGRRGHG